MSPIQFLFGFHGRIGRVQLWLYLLLVAIVHAGLWWQYGCGYDGYPGRYDDDDVGLGTLTQSSDVRIWSSHVDGFHIVTHNPVAALAWLLWLWTLLAVFVKRWHDRDKSGAWMFINAIPLFGWIWTLIECGLMPGTYGPNRYGPGSQEREWVEEW
jgi:uncharacterized membrane protein YhaH (DUF805 family)